MKLKQPTLLFRHNKGGSVLRRTQGSNILYHLSRALVASTFLLIVAGGLVTSREAGLAVPDWPLSYGEFFPPMVGNIFWEHGHRMIAGGVGLFTLAFVLAVQFLDQRVWVKRFAWLLVLTVLAQALLGGLTVLLLLSPVVSILHACLGQTFFCLTVAMMYFLGSDPIGVRPQKNLFRLCALTTAAIFLQLILGAAVRHTGQGIVIHILGAAVILALVLLMTIGVLRAFSMQSGPAKAAVLLGFLTLVQIFLGIGAFIFTKVLVRSFTPALPEVLFTAAHQSTGALLLGLSVWLTLRTKP